MTSRFEPFQRWVALPNLAVLHTETTGLRGEVIELALVDGRGQVLFLARIKPSCPVEPGAQDFHGISDLDLAGVPTIDQYWPALCTLFADRQVVSYNVAFSLQRLEDSLDAVLTPVPGFSDAYQLLYDLSQSAGCAMEAYTPVYDNRGGFAGLFKPARLAVACEREGVETADLPAITTALGSAMRTLRLIRAVAARAEAVDG